MLQYNRLGGCTSNRPCGFTQYYKVLCLMCFSQRRKDAKETMESVFFAPLREINLARRHGSWHLLFGESRDHLIAIRYVPHRGGDDRRRFLYIVGNNPFVRVEIRVV